MASKESKGWVWTDEERASTKNWKRKLRADHDKTAEQLRRFRLSLPALADEAVQAAQPLLEQARPLLDLAGAIERRKYQRISPQEVESHLAAVPEGLSSWNSFLSRPDIQVAIKEANRIQHSMSRLAERADDEQKQELLRQLDTPEFAARLDAEVSVLMKLAEGFAATTRTAPSSPPYGGQEDDRYLQRLLLIYFAGYAVVDDPARIRELRKFVTATPTPPLQAVLRKAVYLLAQVSVTSTPLFRSSLGSLIQVCLRPALKGLQERVEEWRTSKVLPRNLGAEHFQLLGVSYSLGAHPD